MAAKKQKRKLNKAKQLRAIDLFCGCGGLTQGLKQAGYTVIGAVDNEPMAVTAYQANHPDVDVWLKDIRKIDPPKKRKELNLEKGELDLLAGCPPCQGFSTLTTANGAYVVEDDRNDLLHQFYLFAKAFNPKAVMLENVPRLANTQRFKLFLARMKKLGYVGEFRILDAANYRVPQRRKRLIYIAGFKAAISFAVPDSKPRLVRDAIKGLPYVGRSGDPLHDMRVNHSPKIRRMIAKIPKNGGSRTDLPARYVLPCHKEHDGHYDVYGRMSWDEVSPTITSGCFNPSRGRFLHPTQNRAITLREAALLQGFPKTYQFPDFHSKSALALMIGNALPPPFIKAHANAIRKHTVENLRKKKAA